MILTGDVRGLSLWWAGTVVPGPEVRQVIMAKGIMERTCSCHGGQEGKEGRGVGGRRLDQVSPSKSCQEGFTYSSWAHAACSL